MFHASPGAGPVRVLIGLDCLDSAQLFHHRRLLLLKRGKLLIIATHSTTAEFSTNLNHHHHHHHHHYHHNPISNCIQDLDKGRLATCRALCIR